MTARVGYLVVALGTVIVSMGSLQVFVTEGTLWSLVLWITIGVSGLLVIGSGTTLILNAPGDSPTPDPGGAPGKTDAPFGPH